MGEILHLKTWSLQQSVNLSVLRFEPLSQVCLAQIIWVRVSFIAKYDQFPELKSTSQSPVTFCDVEWLIFHNLKKRGQNHHDFRQYEFHYVSFSNLTTTTDHLNRIQDGGNSSFSCRLFNACHLRSDMAPQLKTQVIGTFQQHFFSSSARSTRLPTATGMAEFSPLLHADRVPCLNCWHTVTRLVLGLGWSGWRRMNISYSQWFVH